MDGRILQLLLLCSVCAIVTAQCQQCPNKWIYFRGSCYMFAENTQLNITEASTCLSEIGIYDYFLAVNYCPMPHTSDFYCTSRHDSQLVSIETAAENFFLKDMGHRLRAKESFWTSASDKEVEGTWMWYPSNDPLSYTNWNPGEPNSNNGHNEDCMMLYGPTGDSWHDGVCSWELHPLCEMMLPSADHVIVG